MGGGRDIAAEAAFVELGTDVQASAALPTAGSLDVERAKPTLSPPLEGIAPAPVSLICACLVAGTAGGGSIDSDRCCAVASRTYPCGVESEEGNGCVAPAPVLDSDAEAAQAEGPRAEGTLQGR